MKVARTIGRIAAILAAVGALTALAGVAQADTSSPPSMSQAEYQSEVPHGMTAAEYRALMLRSEALNQTYGVGKQKAVATTSQPTNSTGGFAWEPVGIGAAVVLGLALLAGGFFVRHRLVATRRGVTPPGTT